MMSSRTLSAAFAAVALSIATVAGGAEGLNEVMAGRVDFYCIPVAPAVPLINAGKVTVLAVSTRKRAALLPNVPTVAEAGYPDAEYLYWGGVAAPAKTPTTIVHKLHDEIEKALQLPAVREKLATLGVEEQLLTVEQFDKWSKRALRYSDVRHSVESRHPPT